MRIARVWVLQHAQCETLGTIAEALETSAVSTEYVRTFAGQRVPPDMSEAAGLIVMGGPMGVYEHTRYPFLADEMRLIEQALHAEKPVLGVCLGSQLLAATLGAAVTKGPSKEIGWHPITLSDAAASDSLWRGVPRAFVAYHWHGDVFELPRGAVALAASDRTTHQAFRYGHNAYGFLFHMEVTREIIATMVREFADELREAGVAGHEVLTGTDSYLTPLQAIGATVFQRWAGLV